MNSTAYSRPSKLLVGADDRRPPTRLRGFASKIEPKKLGTGLLVGCCLALLTYLSLAKLFAIYSPVFASTANTSGLLQNAPPASSSSVPETTDAIPAEDTTFIGRENDNAVDPVNFPEEGPAAAGSQDQEPRVPEVLSRKEDEAEKAAAAATSVPKASTEGAAGGEGAAKLSCDENGVDEGFPYARPSVCELSGDIRISPKQKTMYLRHKYS
ncbi:hypothetical protein D1007_15029 [Hordeum vulgare]|nr:hypothetical protein D1007_15029 [Hordeum vulgare]